MDELTRVKKENQRQKLSLKEKQLIITQLIMDIHALEKARDSLIDGMRQLRAVCEDGEWKVIPEGDAYSDKWTKAFCPNLLLSKIDLSK